MAFWRSPHGPLGSGPPRPVTHKEERGKKRENEGERKEKEKKRREEREELETDMGRLFRSFPCLGFVRHCIQGP